MARITPNVKVKIKKLLLPTIGVVAFIWFYLWYFGLPPYYGLTFIYPGKPDKRVVTRVENLMADIRKHHPLTAQQVKFVKTSENWRCMYKRPGLGLSSQSMGLGTLPFIEEMTRSDNIEKRRLGYDVLSDFNISGTHKSCGEWTDIKRELAFRNIYMVPIWERALYDPLPSARGMAIKRLRLGAKGIRIYRRMLRDPNQEIRIAAARKLMWTYKRPYLVPKRLQLQAIHGEYE